MDPWNGPEQNVIHNLLQQKLAACDMATRKGPGGARMHYLESSKAINLANSIFGFNGWSCRIRSIHQDYLEKENGRWTCGVSAIVRIVVCDGTSHEDVGYGSCETARTRGAAVEAAKKEAVSDARKRALRVFGNALGNCVYDKEHLRSIVQGRFKEDSMLEKALVARQQLAVQEGKRNLARSGTGSESEPSAKRRCVNVLHGGEEDPIPHTTGNEPYGIVGNRASADANGTVTAAAVATNTTVARAPTAAATPSSASASAGQNRAPMNGPSASATAANPRNLPGPKTTIHRSLPGSNSATSAHGMPVQVRMLPGQQPTVQGPRRTPAPSVQSDGNTPVKALPLDTHATGEDDDAMFAFSQEAFFDAAINEIAIPNKE